MNLNIHISSLEKITLAKPTLNIKINLLILLAVLIFPVLNSQEFTALSGCSKFSCSLSTPNFSQYPYKAQNKHNIIENYHPTCCSFTDNCIHTGKKDISVQRKWICLHKSLFSRNTYNLLVSSWGSPSNSDCWDTTQFVHQILVGTEAAGPWSNPSNRTRNLRKTGRPHESWTYLQTQNKRKKEKYTRVWLYIYGYLRYQ